ncbi:MAG TPA: metallophosphoesterase, partial [Actinomycetes bacterium]
MPRIPTRPLVLSLLVGLVLPLTTTAPASAATPCATTVTIGYTVQICLTAPDGVLSGSVPLSATVAVWPAVGATAPRVKYVSFDFAGTYLLTDYDPDAGGSYTMSWRTDRMLDTSGTLRARAKLRDGSGYNVTLPATVQNGVQTPFANRRTFSVSTGTTPEPGRPFRLVAVGDGADGSAREAAVVSQIATWQPNLLAYLGDVYERGSAFEFDNWYGSPDGFGRFRSITNPVLGNHEYHTPGAAGFFDYWGDNTPHYYSYDVAGWHVVAIDTTGRFGQLQPGTAQYDWLAADLAANRARCTIATMHHPRYSVSGHKGKVGLAAVWRLLADRRVTLALAGHTHSYERWTSLNRDGVPDPRGVTQLIAGAGGHEAIPPLYSDSRLVSAVPVTGALRLDLGADGADFAYLSTDGSVHDSGFVGCKSTGDTLPPSRPAGLTATATSGTSADLAWQPSTDPAGLGGYRVRRNGRVVATVGPSATSYAEAGLVGGATYVWTVDAFDPSENYSQQSVPVALTMPAAARPTVSTRTLLGDLRRGSETSRGYRRTKFGTWADADGDGCTTRAEVLVAEAVLPPTMTETCGLSGGRWLSTWNGTRTGNQSALGVGAAVPLGEAWRSGAKSWTSTTRRALLNDLGYRGSLSVVTERALRSRGNAE